MRRFLFAAAMVFVAGGLRAGDEAELNFIGFSEDGARFAYEQFGVQDGSGFGYSQFLFVDAAKNAWAGPPQGVEDEKGDSLEAVRARARKAAEASLQKFGIQVGNTGDHLLSHPTTDLGVEDRTAKFRLPSASEPYELRLEETPVKNAVCEERGQPAALLTVTLTGSPSGNVRVLQKDAALPRSRGACPGGYRVQDVYVFKNTLAVFLNVYTAGFEGPDMRHLALGSPLETK